MSTAHAARRWIWAAVALQLVGLAYDAVWHGVVHAGVEPQTRYDMAVHLITVHLPLYCGVLAVLITTVRAIIGEMLASRVGAGWWVALGGALLSVVGEVWHAVMHLQLEPHRGAVAGMLSPIGLVVVAATVWRLGRRAIAEGEHAQRRAA